MQLCAAVAVVPEPEPAVVRPRSGTTDQMLRKVSVARHRWQGCAIALHGTGSSPSPSAPSDPGLLYFFDPEDPTGRYKLDLGTPEERQLLACPLTLSHPLASASCGPWAP